MLVNLQKRYAVSRLSLLPYVRSLKRRLRLGRREFNLCFVDDDGIRRLNAAFRGKDEATDVLSFPWAEDRQPGRGKRNSRARLYSGGKERKEFANFLGDIAISVDTARRNAAREGHSPLNEIRWLIPHGVLHLLGYDHEDDNGEMIELELALREQLRIERRSPKLANRKLKTPSRAKQ